MTSLYESFHCIAHSTTMPSRSPLVETIGVTVSLFSLRYSTNEMMPPSYMNVFSHAGEGVLTVESSVWLEKGRLRPRDTLQIVLAGRAIQPTTRLRWTLAKGYGTPEGLRDLNPGPAWDEEDE